MILHRKIDDDNKIEILSNAVQYDKKRLDDLCTEFDAIDSKSHKSKFEEYEHTFSPIYFNTISLTFRSRFLNVR